MRKHFQSYFIFGSFVKIFYIFRMKCSKCWGIFLEEWVLWIVWIFSCLAGGVSCGDPGWLKIFEKLRNSGFSGSSVIQEIPQKRCSRKIKWNLDQSQRSPNKKSASPKTFHLIQCFPNFLSRDTLNFWQFEKKNFDSLEKEILTVFATQ